VTVSNGLVLAAVLTVAAAALAAVAVGTAVAAAPETEKTIGAAAAGVTGATGLTAGAAGTTGAGLGTAAWAARRTFATYEYSQKTFISHIFIRTYNHASISYFTCICGEKVLYSLRLAQIRSGFAGLDRFERL
jgi:hypothetical protein